MSHVRSRPSATWIKAVPERCVPDDAPGECTIYRARVVGLKRFNDFVKSLPLRVEYAQHKVDYYDDTGLLRAQIVWDENGVGSEFCTQTVFEQRRS